MKNTEVIQLCHLPSLYQILLIKNKAVNTRDVTSSVYVQTVHGLSFTCDSEYYKCFSKKSPMIQCVFQSMLS